MRNTSKVDVYLNLIEHAYRVAEIEIDEEDDVIEVDYYPSMLGTCEICFEYSLLNDRDRCHACEDFEDWVADETLPPARNISGIKDRNDDGTVSSGEHKLLAILREMYPDNEIIVNDYYDWLISPYKERPMQLDFYIPSLKLAFEYDGPHHFMPLRGRIAYLHQVARDRTKDAICAENGVRLIRIKYDEPLSRELIEAKLREEVAA